MNSKRGREIHGKAEKTRESGNSLEALKLYAEATIVYQEDNDYLGMSEVQSSRQLTLGHLHDKTEDKAYLVLAKHAAMSAVEIAEKFGDKTALALPYERLGQAYEALEEMEEAIRYYEKAVAASEDKLSEFHDNNSVRAEIRSRLATAKLANGEEKALKDALTTIEEIKEAEVGEYVHDVWVSGIYMRLAEATKDKKYLAKAKEVIDGNKELVLRKAQLEKLSASI